MPDHIIDLARAAALAKDRAEGKAGPADPKAHPGWAPFIAQIEQLRKVGRAPVKKVFDLLWLGYRNGFEEAVRQVSASFQSGNFKLEGYPPSYWVRLKELAADVAAGVEEDGYADDLSERASRLATYFAENEQVTEETEPEDLDFEDIETEAVDEEPASE